VKRKKVKTPQRRSVARPWRTGVRHLKIKRVSPLLLGDEPVQDSLKRVIRLLGSNQTADLLGVSKSQTSRWLHGEPIGAISARRIADFDYVLARALRVFHPDEAAAFFTFPQPFLNGARPIDVLVMRGAAPVIVALDQIDEGAFI